MSKQLALAFAVVTASGLSPFSPVQPLPLLAAAADAPLVGTWKLNDGGKKPNVLRITKLDGGKVEGTLEVVGHFGRGPNLPPPPVPIKDATFAKGVFEFIYVSGVGSGRGTRFTGNLGADGSLSGTYVVVGSQRPPGQMKWTAIRDPDAK